MVSYFVTVDSDVITGVHSGDIHADLSGTAYHGHNRVEVPQGAQISVLDRIQYYDASWKRKPDIRLIDEGLMPMPQGYKRDGDSLRRMTQEERVIAGLEELPTGYKLVNNELAPMTLLEQLAAGQITQEDYEQALAAENNGELQRRLAELQTPECLAQAEIDGEYAVERKAKLAALLAVRDQDGWPLEAEWPE